MSDRIIFGNTLLKGINKAGHLKCDDNGYYTTVLGAIGIENSAGEVYTDSVTARNTFIAKTGRLQKRLEEGLLRGEFGHPDQADYPNLQVFERRVRMIHQDRVSHHIKEIWLEEIIYMGKKVLGILGKVRPSGPFGPTLKDMFDNKDENVTFSGRYYSNLSMRGGIVHREIHTVGTWDFVTEPGVAPSQKYLSPSLESVHDVFLDATLLEEASRLEKSDGSLARSMESGGFSAEALMLELGLNPRDVKTSIILDW